MYIENFRFENYVLRDRRKSKISCPLDADVDIIFLPYSIIDPDPDKGFGQGTLVGYADEQLAAHLKSAGIKMEED
jgi:hypothetical protein